MDDVFEDNDAPQDAAAMDFGTYTSLVASDDDWFRLQPSGPGTISVIVAGGGGDLDLAAYDTAGHFITGSSREATSKESFTITSEGGALIILVRPYEALVVEYDLVITWEQRSVDGEHDDKFESNNVMEDAKPIALGTTTDLFARDDDWYLLDFTRSEVVTVMLAGNDVGLNGHSADLDLIIYDRQGVLLGASENSHSMEWITLNGDAGPLIILDRVMHFRGCKPMLGVWQGSLIPVTSRMTSGRLSRRI